MIELPHLKLDNDTTEKSAPNVDFVSGEVLSELSSILYPYIGWVTPFLKNEIPGFKLFGINLDHVTLEPTGSSFDGLSHPAPMHVSHGKDIPYKPYNILQQFDFDYMMSPKNTCIIPAETQTLDEYRSDAHTFLKSASNSCHSQEAQGTNPSHLHKLTLIQIEDTAYAKVYDVIEHRFVSNTEFIESCFNTYVSPSASDNIITLQRSGPAMSVTVLGGAQYVYSIDIVSSLFCPVWPPFAEAWVDRKRRTNWPSETLINEIVLGGCHVVPVGRPRGAESQLEWRMSFSKAEKLLALSFTDIQRQCYILLRRYMKTFISPPAILPNFFLKTTMFWTLEKIPLGKWTKDDIGELIVDLLNSLIRYVVRRQLPHYFIPTYNLLASVHQDFCKTVACKLSHLRRHVLTIFQQDAFCNYKFGITLPWSVREIVTFRKDSPEKLLLCSKVNENMSIIFHWCQGSLERMKGLYMEGESVRDFIDSVFRNLKTLASGSLNVVSEGEQTTIVDHVFYYASLHMSRKCVGDETRKICELAMQIASIFGTDIDSILVTVFGLLMSYLDSDIDDESVLQFLSIVMETFQLESKAITYIGCLLNEANKSISNIDVPLRHRYLGASVRNWLVVLMCRRYGFLSNSSLMKIIINNLWHMTKVLLNEGEATRAVIYYKNLLDLAMDAYETGTVQEMSLVTGIALDAGCTYYRTLKNGSVNLQVFAPTLDGAHKTIRSVLELSFDCDPSNVAAYAEFLNYLYMEEQYDDVLSAMEFSSQIIPSELSESSPALEHSNVYDRLDVTVVDENVRKFLTNSPVFEVTSAFLVYYIAARSCLCLSLEDKARGFQTEMSVVLTAITNCLKEDSTTGPQSTNTKAIVHSTIDIETSNNTDCVNKNPNGTSAVDDKQTIDMTPTSMEGNIEGMPSKTISNECVYRGDQFPTYSKTSDAECFDIQGFEFRVTESYAQETDITIDEPQDRTIPNNAIRGALYLSECLQKEFLEVREYAVK